MQFRWVVAIALWTFLAGPAIGPPGVSRWAPRAQSSLHVYGTRSNADSVDGRGSNPR